MATITSLDQTRRESQQSTDPLARKLAAILYADVAGYSRLSGEDEEGTHRSLRACIELMETGIKAHNGRIVNYAGDAVLADFGTVIDAVTCAAAIQEELKQRNAPLPEGRRVQFRIGVNLGDVIVDREEIYGDGVNVAARLASLADPGGIYISESVFSSVGKKLPLHYEFIGEQQVKNIAEPVRAYRVVLDSEATLVTNRWRKLVGVRHSLTAIAGMMLIGAIALWAVYQQPLLPPVTRAGAETHSIAVLPFANMSGDLKQEYFADGITDDLITDLTKISGLLVIARESTFMYKGESKDIRHVARQLNVRYVLEGSVRRTAEQVRINVQLIDATTGANLWAERYDSEIGNIFVLQDEITKKIVLALAVKLTTLERQSLARQDTNNPDAYQYFLQGQEYYHRHSKEDTREARKLYQKAIELDPNFARVYAMLGLTYWFEFANGWSEEAEHSLERARVLAEQAITLNDTLPEAHFLRGLVFRERREYAKALNEAEKAIAIDPNYANGRVLLASVLYYAGRAEEGLERMKEAVRLNPHHPHNYPFHLGQAYFILGRYDEAIRIFKQGLDSNPKSQRLRLWLAAAYAQAGRINDAEWELDLVLMKDPDFSLKRIQQAYPFKYSADLGVFLDSLRKAGLPEEG